MQLSALAGNLRLKEQLSRQEKSRGLSHAYIISGPAGSGKHTLAGLLSAAMVCTAGEGSLRPCGRCGPCKKAMGGIHPDIANIAGIGAGKPIAVDQIRALRRDAFIRPNEADRKVYVLEDAQSMNASAQNAMLKLLEEGPRYAAFLLLADNGGGLLETVRSRCEQLTLTPVPQREGLSWLINRFPGKPMGELEQVLARNKGFLGQAAAEIEGGENTQLEEQARKLARAMMGTDEMALFECSMVLESGAKDQITPLLNRTQALLVAAMAKGQDRRKLLRGVDLLKQLVQAAQFNANPGQMAGWLCAGMFYSEKG